MNIFLKYNYGFKKPIICKDNENYLIKENGKYYKLLKIQNQTILKQIMYLEKNSIFENGLIVRSNSGNITTIYKNNEYLLQRYNKDIVITKKEIFEKKNIDLNNNINRNYTNNWYKLWTEKTDYFQKLKSSNQNDDLYAYYMGMSENAISMLNNNEKKDNNNNFICHRRINNKDYDLVSNIVIDCKEREIAEYIKYLFFDLDKEIMSEELQEVIEEIIRENLSYELIYARLLFPTYYFDICEQKDEEKSDKEIKKLKSKIEKYEMYLKLIYNSIKKNKEVKKIDWL